MALGLGGKPARPKRIKKARKRTSQGQDMTLDVIADLRAALDKASTRLKVAQKTIERSKP